MLGKAKAYFAAIAVITALAVPASLLAADVPAGATTTACGGSCTSPSNQSTGTGTTTLSLPDEELSLNTSTGTVTGTRYYNLGGTTVAALTAPASATSSVTSRELPAGEKGFIGGTDDSATGLTNLGAREYQPLSGSFVSPDPMQYAYDPQDLNAYSYATDNPTTLSDPSGASPIIPGPVRIPEPILTGSTGATPTDVPGDQINGPHGCKGSTVQEVLDCEHTVLENDWKIVWSNYKKRLGLVWDCSLVTPPTGC